MAEVLPNMYNSVGHNYQHWSPPDEKDAYIGWLKGEFAAANAIIDSMCHHMRTIGSPGEYESVFGCINRRRQAWTPSLYMQQFYSIADVVNSLHEVAWQKHQAQRSAAMAANPLPKPCPSPEDENNKPFVKKAQNTTIQLHQAHESIPSRDGANGILCVPKTGKVQACNAACNGVLSSDEEGNGLLSYNEQGNMKQGNVASETSSSTSDECCKSVDDSIDDKLTELPTDKSSPLDTKGNIAEKLLNMGIRLASDNVDTRITSIKRSLQFQCCEHVDGQVINDGESAELCENVFSDEEIKEMAEIVCQLQAAGQQGDLGCAFCPCEDSRSLPDIMQFGYKHSNGAEMNESQPLPAFIEAIIKWLTRCSILSGTMKPDSCLISIFDEGDFVSPNTDEGFWENPLCVISIVGNCTMVFGHSISTDQQGVCKGPNQVTLPAGSVLLLQENFTGILQKAVPASPSRRITIALGKAASNNGIMKLNFANSAGKSAKDRPWPGMGRQNGNVPFVNNGAMKQGGSSPIPLDPLPPMPHLVPHHPFPSIQPMIPNITGGLMNPCMPHSAMAPQVWACPPVPQKLHNAGTGVFFPSCDLNGGISPWQSGLLVLSSFSRKNGSLVASTAGLDIRRSRKAEKHAAQARARGSFESMDMKGPKKKLGKHVSLAETCQKSGGTGCGEANQAS